MKRCTKCGTMLDDNAGSCYKCGASFNNAVIPPQQPQQQYQQARYDQPIYQQPQQPQYQQAQYDQPLYQQPQYQQPQQFQQQYQPQFQPQYAAAGVPGGAAAAKGSKKKLIIIISAIVAVIGITLLILFLFVFKSNKDKIIGTWVCDGEYIRFDKDGKLTFLSGGGVVDYKIDGDNLIITYNYSGSKSTESNKIIRIDSKEMQLQNSKGKIATFAKVDDNEPENNLYKSKAALKTANANAKLIFTTCSNKASDMIADNEKVDKLEYSGPVSGLSGVLGNAVKEALKDNGADSGYVYIYYDPNDDYATDSQNFAQWSATESGSVIGQYPNPQKSVDESLSISFGTRKR